MDKSQRIAWLAALKPEQVRALACQKELATWRTAPITSLLQELSDIEYVEVPTQTLGEEL